MWRLLVCSVVMLVSCASIEYLEPADHRTTLVLKREADGTISTTITNTSEQTIALVKHSLPAEMLFTPLFTVEQEGEKLPYFGMIAEPGYAFNPESAYLSSTEFVLLPPGQHYETRTLIRNFRKDYALPPKSSFSVFYDAGLHYAVVSRPVDRIKYKRINQFEKKRSNVLLIR